MKTDTADVKIAAAEEVTTTFVDKNSLDFKNQIGNDQLFKNEL